MKLFRIFLLLMALSKTQNAIAEIILKDGTIQTSMIRVLANPEKYEGKRILVIGYYVKQFEHRSIYFHREDAKYAIYENAIWVNDPMKISPLIDLKVSKKYCKVAGVFTQKRGGHMGLWPGELTDVSFLHEQVRSKD